VKVSQLIEALGHMPPDAWVVTHANNHTTGDCDSMRVALFGQRCVVGNWDKRLLHEIAGRHKPLPADVHTVRNYGPYEDQLIIETYVTRPGIYPYDGTPTIDELLLTAEEIRDLTRKEEAAAQAVIDAERAEYERLKAKYGSAE
jgi:hypothetical protein